MKQKRQRGQSTKQTNNSPYPPLGDNNRRDTASAVTACPPRCCPTAKSPAFGWRLSLSPHSHSSPPFLSPFLSFSVCDSLCVSFSWGLAVCVCVCACVCVLSRSVSVLLLFSLDVALSQTFIFSLPVPLFHTPAPSLKAHSILAYSALYIFTCWPLSGHLLTAFSELVSLGRQGGLFCILLAALSARRIPKSICTWVFNCFSCSGLCAFFIKAPGTFCLPVPGSPFSSSWLLLRPLMHACLCFLSRSSPPHPPIQPFPSFPLLSTKL